MRFLHLAAVWVLVCSPTPSLAQLDPFDNFKKRTPQDSAAIQTRVDRFPSLPADSLQLEVDELQQLHEKNLKTWKAIQDARNAGVADTTAVESRGAAYTLGIWKNVQTRDTQLRKLTDREKLEFEKKYGEPFGPRAKNLAAWAASDEGKAIEAERAKAQKEFDDTAKKLTEKARSGDTERDKQLDDLQKHILDEFQVTAHAVRKAREALAARKAADAAKSNPPTPPAPPAPPPVHIPPLSCHIDRSLKPSQIVEVGETLELTVIVRGGQKPYDLIVRTSDGFLQHLTLTEPGERTFPFTFKTSQYPHVVEFAVTDAKGSHAKDKYKVTVHPRRPDPTPPAPPMPAPVLPPAPKPPLVSPLTGTYRALFWVPGGPGNPAGVGSRPGSVLPNPVRITFEAGGVVTGACDYEAEDNQFDPTHRRNYQEWGWRGTFTLRGTVDWNTGLLNLTIPSGKAVSHTVWQPKPTDTRIRTDFAFEYGATFRGRHTIDPHWDPFLDKLTPQAFQARGIDPERSDERGNPNLRLNAAGRYRYCDDGWVGQASSETGIDVSRYDVKKDSITITAGDSKTVQDSTAARITQYQSLKGPRCLSWYLKLIGPDTTGQDLAKAELVATSLWPERTTTAAVGENVYARFVGVFSDHYTQLRELTDIADWQLSPGLKQVRPGVFRADKPGKYEVRARAKGKSGTWMEGYLTIEVNGP